VSEAGVMDLKELNEIVGTDVYLWARHKSI